MLNAVYSLLMPGGLILLGAYACTRVLELPDPISDFWRWAPSVVLAGGISIGGRFGRSQLALGCVALLLLDWWLMLASTPALQAAVGAQVALGAVAVLVPLNFLLLSLAEDRGLLSRTGMFRLLGILCQPIGVAWLCVRWPVPMDDLLGRNFLGAITAAGPVPQLAWAMFGCAIALLAIQYFLDRNDIASGFCWALLCALAALHVDPVSAEARLYVAGGGMVLVASVIESLYRMAFRDELTELPSRRALSQASLDLEGQFATAMVDVDHFKRFNDTWGHDVGDQLLRMVAFKLARVTGGGRSFRYGGEEFTILFPGKQAIETLPHLEAVRMAIEETSFTIRSKGARKPEDRGTRRGKNECVSVTVSIGVAASRGPKADPADVIRAADEALYRAKDNGRNQVCS